MSLYEEFKKLIEDKTAQASVKITSIHVMYILSNTNQSTWLFISNKLQKQYKNSKSPIMDTINLNTNIEKEFQNLYPDKMLPKTSSSFSQRLLDKLKFLNEYLEFRIGRGTKFKDEWSLEDWNNTTGDVGAEKPIYKIKDNYYDEVKSNMQKLFDDYKDTIKAIVNDFSFKEKKRVEEKEKRKGADNPLIVKGQPLNQILYGPPGTGKTYNTIDKSLEIIFEQENKKETIFYDFDFDFEQEEISYDEALFIEDEDIKRKVLKNIFNHYVNAGQIEFVTFHQSYGYEEFVEGIKAIPPRTEDNENNEMIYKVVDGIFKRISKKAQQEEYFFNDINFDSDVNIWKISLGGTYEHPIKKKCFEDNEIRIGWTNVKEVGDEEYTKLGSNNQSSIKNFMEDMSIGDFVISIYSKNEIDGIGIIESDYKYEEHDSYDKVRKVKWLSREIIDLKKLNGNRSFVQKTVYPITRFKPVDLLKLIHKDRLEVKNSNLDKKYILIIDEINRGNISKIFGELITLIEDSKRLGNNESVEITLPYSGEKFSVPNNLYILGTMNTADRSIALMDTALRRRFHFEEMMPKPELLDFEVKIDEESVNIKKLLQTINKRIEYLYDRDHTIGHAYFMSLKGIEDEDKQKIELDNIFRNKIIPLLQEYFYDDWEKIQMVLGDHKNQDAKDKDKFIRSVEYTEKTLFGFDHEDIEDNQTTYIINKNFKIAAYKKIKEYKNKDDN